MNTPACHVVGHHKPNCCRCCGERVIEIGPKGELRTLPRFRGVRFIWHGPNCGPQGAVSGINPFCEDCAKHPWTAERLTAIKRQMDDADALSDQGKRYQMDQSGNWSLVNFKKPVDPVTAHINKSNRAALTIHHTEAELITTIPDAAAGPIRMTGPKHAVGAGVLGETVGLSALD